MPTSHRAAGRARGMGSWLTAAAVIVVIVVGVIVALSLSRGGSSPGTTPPSTSPSASGSPSASPSPTASPSTAKKSTRPKPAAVPDSPPHELTIGDLVSASFGSSVEPVDNHLVPDGPSRMQRLSTRGTPGSPGTDTVVLVGAANDRGTGVLDRLDEAKTGQTVVLTTQTGTLTYRITALLHVSPDAVLGTGQVRAHAAGRLVIDRAEYVGGNRTGRDLVVIAQLVKAEPLRP